jgi:hypothetical protein
MMFPLFCKVENPLCGRGEGRFITGKSLSISLFLRERF